jgi:drug/metabolite transporter (DMT)-like permease
MKIQLKADLMLVCVAAFWGSSCLLTKIALEDLQEFNLVAIRFIFGFVLSFFALFRKLRIDKKCIGYAAALGTNYLAVLMLMTYGVKYTTVSKAGFLTCLASVFVPFISVVILKKKLSRKTIFCAAATFVGVYLLTMSGTAEGTGINIGDVLSTFCSVFFAIQILLTGFFVVRTDALTLTVFQMGFVGVYSLLCSLLFEAPKLSTTMVSWLCVIGLCLLSTVIALIMQNIAQKYTSATRASIILSLEPAFTVLSAYLVLGETLAVGGYAGGAILLASIILLEIDFP